MTLPTQNPQAPRATGSVIRLNTPQGVYTLLGHTPEEVADFIRFLKKEGKL